MDCRVHGCSPRAGDSEPVSEVKVMGAREKGRRAGGFSVGGESRCRTAEADSGPWLLSRECVALVNQFCYFDFIKQLH